MSVLNLGTKIVTRTMSGKIGKIRKAPAPIRQRLARHHHQVITLRPLLYPCGYPCTRCPAKLRNQHILDRHVASHGAGRRYVCSLCDYSSTTRRIIAIHEECHANARVASSSSSAPNLPGAFVPFPIPPLTVTVAGGAIDIDEEMPSLTPNIEPQTGNMALTSENLKLPCLTLALPLGTIVL